MGGEFSASGFGTAGNVLAALKDRLAEPSSRGLAEAVIAAIRAGDLAEGDQLPPIRAVASAVGVSPTTVSAAWSLLVRAGTIRTDGRRGTTVSQRSGFGPRRYRRALGEPSRFELDLSSGVPDPVLLPDLAPALRRLPSWAGAASYLDDPVLPGLVDALRPSWAYKADAFTVCDGAMDAMSLVCAALLRFGDKVVVEHPSFPPLLDLLDSVGAQVIGVAVDSEGMCADRLSEALAAGPAAVFLQPRAHNPTGVSLTRRRAQQLSQILGEADVLVVEDDSAGMVAASAPLSVGSWIPDKTVHVRSFSKSHGPDLRLAAMSGPSSLIGRLNDHRHLGQGWTSRLLQALLCDLLTDPAVMQSVATARTSYAARRRAVVDLLADRGIAVGGTEGLNIWLPVREESAALVRLASQGIAVAAGRPFQVLSGDAPHVRVTTGLITDPGELPVIAARLAEAAEVGGSAGPR